MNNFQTILIAVFLAITVFGVLVFAGIIPLQGGSSSETLKGNVSIWGTFDSTEFNKILDEVESANDGLSISYTKKSKDEYQNELIEAFAKGKGPDLFFITPDMIIENDSFIHKIPFKSYPEKTFRDTFLDGGDIFLDQDKIIAFPMAVNPIVMYYNKNLLANEGLVNPPVNWDDLFEINNLLTKKENNGVINQSMIALGQYQNINYAKEIISTLFLQNNNPIIKRNGDKAEVYLNDLSVSGEKSLAQEAIDFYVQFSNMSNSAYSWNRSLPSSFNMFISGKLAIYIGLASDLFKIQRANPNLSFDVAQIPQIRNSTVKRTYGEIYSLAISNRTKDLSTTYSLATILLGSDYAERIASVFSLPPASRSLLSNRPENPYLFTFYNSAIISRSWLDPDYQETNNIFQEMIDNIISNRYSTSEALGRAGSQIRSLLK